MDCRYVFHVKQAPSLIGPSGRLLPEGEGNPAPWMTDDEV
jgi:hypothetical protein